MKLLIANIRREKLEAVREVLDRAEVAVMYASEVADTWRRRPRMYRGVQYQISEPRLRLEILIEDDSVAAELVNAVTRAACANYAGLHGSGDLFLLPVEHWTSIGARATVSYTADQPNMEPATVVRQ